MLNQRLKLRCKLTGMSRRRITTMSLRIVRNIDVQTKIKIITNVIPNLCYLSSLSY